MKKIINLLLVLLVLVLTSCGSRQSGQLTGVINRPAWKGINPYGMVYVPSGTVHIGPSDQDVSNTFVQRQKSISIQGFYMDDTEVTNNEYRQFVYWVRDSLAHSYLEHYLPEDEDSDRDEPLLDWDEDIDWTDEAVQDMFYQGDDRFADKKELDVNLLEFEYEWFDWKRAAHSKDPSVPRNSFITRKTANIYPDTLVWVRDFSYSYNEPMARNYFWHPAFDDYPVVGVDWHMATAFSYWRTKLWNSYEGGVISEDFRLPTEHEWEYAARGGHDLAPYPWGGYYVRNAKGCLLANFKPGRGNYPEDGGQYTVKADAYFPNDYGLYNMSGNVAEWTSSAYYENAYAFVHDLNPDIRYDAKDDDPKGDKRKVIRGGSWKDVMHFLQTGSRHYEYQDTTKSYVGFRCVLTFLGRSINDNF
ncbi:MAG: SUMF1/EgtB/PvdO family nonheme iron enzyme [Bacteroidota bacterium]